MISQYVRYWSMNYTSICSGGIGIFLLTTVSKEFHPFYYIVTSEASFNWGKAARV